MSNITSLLILALGVYGVMLIFMKDTALPEQIRGNKVVQSVYNNSTIMGSICIGAAYYTYTHLPNQTKFNIADTSEMTTATPDIPLPTYEQATSDAL